MEGTSPASVRSFRPSLTVEIFCCVRLATQSMSCRLIASRRQTSRKYTPPSAMQPTRWLERKIGEFSLSQRSCQVFCGELSRRRWTQSNPFHCECTASMSSSSHNRLINEYETEDIEERT